MTFREEIIGEARLLLGDCREILPTLGKVGHIFTDPPYEDEVHKAFGSIRQIRTDGKQRSRHSSLDFESVNVDRNAFARILSESCEGWLLVFTLAEGVTTWRDDIQQHGGKWHGTLFWVKPDAAPRFNGQGPARGAECAALAWCGGGYRSWNAGGKRGVYTHCVNMGRQGEHPTEKPVPLMAEILTDFTQPGQLICDPFMGSGTTGVACIQHGRRFVGVEQNPKWFDLACRRIEAAARQPRLFAEPIPKPTQLALLEPSA